MVDDNLDRQALSSQQSNPFVSATLPADYRKGDQLLASTINEIMNRVRGLSRTGVGLGVSGRPEHAHMALVKNVSGVDISWRQLVEITGVSLGGLNISECDVPSADGLTLIAVTAEPIPVQGLGFAYISGSCLVQYEGDVPAIGDRVGSQTGSTIAVLGESPLIVIGTETIDAVTYALVLFSPAGGGQDAIEFVITTLSSGDAFGTGFAGFLEVPFACEIIACRMLANESTTTTVDIWLDTYADAPPTNADSITAAAVPTISGALKDEDTTLAGWTTAIPAGSWLGFNVDANDNAKNLTISLTVTR